MPYCSNCGHKLVDNAKFCSKCGTPIAQPQPETSTEHERREVFEGKVYKCPNCGEALPAFVPVCPACGFELRNIVGSSSIQKLIDEIKNLETPKDFSNYDTASRSSMLKLRLSQEENDSKIRKISNLIENFPIPNTKEDMFEFLVLASANINIVLLYPPPFTDEDRSQRPISRAWYAKFEQVYQKARLAFGDNPDFFKIKDIYDNKMVEIEKQKNCKENLKYYFGVV